MKLVTISGQRDVAGAIETLDTLRKHLESGYVVAFAVAAVTHNDEALAYVSSTTSVSRLRVQGAIAQLQHNWLSGEVG